MKTFLRAFLLINVILLGTIYFTFCYLELEWLDLFIENEKVDRGLVVFLFFCSVSLSIPISFGFAQVDD